MANGRYTPMKNEYLKTPPTKKQGESDRDYKLRLRQWNIARNKGGSRDQTQRGGKSQPLAAPQHNAKGWMGKVIDALGGSSKEK